MRTSTPRYRKIQTLAASVAALAVAIAASATAAPTEEGPSLGAARDFAVLAGSTVTSAGLSVVVGNVGVSPGSEIVGFPPATVSLGTVQATTVLAAHAHADAALAYAYLKGMPTIPANNRTSVDLAGLTLSPGVYTFNTSAMLTGDLTLDAGGDSSALFVIQIGSTLTTSSGAHVNVINGGANYDMSKVFWQVGSSATLGSGTSFVGNIIAYSSITLVSGSTLNGSALALIGAVTMDASTVTSPPPSAPPVPVIGAPEPPLDVDSAPSGIAGDGGAVVTWTDASINETEFRVFRRDGASAKFVLIGVVPTRDAIGMGTAMTFTDSQVDPSPTYSYRVTAFSTVDGESVPSVETRVDAGPAPLAGDPGSSRWLDVTLQGSRARMKDRVQPQGDSLLLVGRYSLVVVDNGVPTIVRPDDPSAAEIAIQIRSPGSVLYLNIPANDPGWHHRNSGASVWRSPRGTDGPVFMLRMDPRKSKFWFRVAHSDFDAVPTSSITVSLRTQNASGSETREWAPRRRLPRGARAQFSLSNSR